MSETDPADEVIVIRYRCCTCNGTGLDTHGATCGDCSGVGIDNHGA